MNLIALDKNNEQQENKLTKILFNVSNNSLINEYNLTVITDKIKEKKEALQTYKDFKFSNILYQQQVEERAELNKLNKQYSKLSTVISEDTKEDINLSKLFVKDSSKISKLQTLSTQDKVTNFFNMDIKLTSDLVSNSKEILEKLTDIEANQIDEQDTDVKKYSDSQKEKEFTDTPIVNEKEEKTWFEKLIDNTLPFLATSILPFLMDTDTAKLTQFATKIVAIGGKALFNAIELISKSAITALGGLIKPLIESVSAAAKTLTEFVKPISTVISNVKSVLKTFIEKIPGVVIPNEIKQFLSITKDNVKAVSEVSGAAAKGVSKVLKKAPVLGFGISTGLAIKRATEGDYVGAGLEMASGVLSLFPGLGTAGSLGIDAYLIHRDYNKSSEALIQEERNKITKEQNIKKAIESNPELIQLNNEYNQTVNNYKEFVNKGGKSNSVEGQNFTNIMIKNRAEYAKKTAAIKESAISAYNNTSQNYPGGSAIEIASSQIKKHEGYNPKWYKDAHGYSIGYGHFGKGEGSKPVSSIIGRDVPMGGTITKEEGELLFKYDLNRSANDLYSLWPWVKKQPVNIQANLIDMSYNLGKSRLSKFQPTAEYIKSGDYQTAANRLRKTAWYSQVGNRAKNIIYDIENTNPNISENPITNNNIISNKEDKEIKQQEIITNISKNFKTETKSTILEKTNTVQNNYSLTKQNNQKYDSSNNLMNLFYTGELNG